MPNDPAGNAYPIHFPQEIGELEWIRSIVESVFCDPRVDEEILTPEDLELEDD